VRLAGALICRYHFRGLALRRHRFVAFVIGLLGLGVGWHRGTGKDPNDFGGSAVATALFGRARSIASCNLPGLPDTQTQPDSRRYRKRSARFWRQHGGDCAFWSGSLSCFVQPSRTARCSGLAGQSPLPEKIRTILEATRWRLRFLVGLALLLRATFSDCQMLRPSRTVAATTAIAPLPGLRK
jgi:hypothetical protein